MLRRLPPTIRQLLSPNTPIPTFSASSPIAVNGWIKSIRRQKNVSFVMLNDGSSAKSLQAVLKPEATMNLTNGTCVRFSGQLCQSNGRGQERELHVQHVEVLGTCDPEKYPIQKQELSIEYLRDQCHLRSRTDKIAAMLRVRDDVERSVHSFFAEQAFQSVHAPIITSSDCEGGGETFSVTPSSADPDPDPDSPNPHFFGSPAYLTVSSQLHLEALASSLSRVYTLAPCFRAERSQTSRHLAEFWMLEAEWMFTQSIADVCDFVEDLCKHLIRDVALRDKEKEGGNPDIEMFWHAQTVRRNLHVDHRTAKVYYKQMEEPWTRITYTDAMRELVQYHESSPKHGFEYKPVWSQGLHSEHERFIAEKIFDGPVFITNYPTSVKPFYMRQNDDHNSISESESFTSHSHPNSPTDTSTVSCFDLIIPHIGELAGGSLREERLSRLDAALSRHGLDKRGFGWYRDLRKYGGAPHGGFGMGFERLISWLTGVENVRECIAMPRWAGRMLL